MIAVSLWLIELPCKSMKIIIIIQINNDRKATKYIPLIADLQNSYSTVKFINLSKSALGILGTSSESFPSMLTDVNFDDNT